MSDTAPHSHDRPDESMLLRPLWMALLPFVIIALCYACVYAHEHYSRGGPQTPEYQHGRMAVYILMLLGTGATLFVSGAISLGYAWHKGRTTLLIACCISYGMSAVWFLHYLMRIYAR